MSNQYVKISKFLSLVLRHNPQKIGLTLDDEGWADVDDLLVRMNKRGKNIDHALLREVVETNDKQRFTFSDDGTRIRANQGHSIDISLGLTPQVPPSTLFHGTASRFWPSIQREGLKKMNRQHVHLSRDLETASKVGVRHGKLLVLTIDAEQMHADGFHFFLSKNGVWLTDTVPVDYISTDSSID